MTLTVASPETAKLKEDLRLSTYRCYLCLKDLLSDNGYAVKRLFDKLDDRSTYEAAEEAIEATRSVEDALLDVALRKTK